MDLGLRGKVALVAAASKGLGRATAEELAAEGAKLAICSRDEEAIEAVGGEIAKATGAEVFTRAADVSRAADVGAFVDATLACYGRVDILVTKSGGPDAVRAGRVRASRAPGHEAAPLGPHPERHVDRGEAAGREPDALEQTA